MNRLQKKCVIGTVGFHLLLLVILIVGPAFFNPKPKVDDAQVLDVIPADAIESALNSGIKNATPPPPQPIVQPPQPQPQPQQQPTPPAPKPPEPKPSIIERVEKVFKPEPKPELVKPAPKRVEIPKHKIEVNTHLVTRHARENTANPHDAKAVANAIRNLKSNLKSGTQINLSGSSDVASVNYASIVRSVYDAAWTLPNTIAKDENITVKVTIGSDGTVISSRIITPSGDAPGGRFGAARAGSRQIHPGISRRFNR